MHHLELVGFSGHILAFGVGPHWVFSYLIKTARFGLVHFYSAVPAHTEEMRRMFTTLIASSKCRTETHLVLELRAPSNTKFSYIA